MSCGRNGKFERELRAADLRETSVRTYVDRTAIFLRWLAGDYQPQGPGLAFESWSVRTAIELNSSWVQREANYGRLNMSWVPHLRQIMCGSRRLFGGPY
jgi:hypothetical protein